LKTIFRMGDLLLEYVSFKEKDFPLHSPRLYSIYDS